MFLMSSLRCIVCFHSLEGHKKRPELSLLEALSEFPGIKIEKRGKISKKSGLGFGTQKGVLGAVSYCAQWGGRTPDPTILTCSHLPYPLQQLFLSVHP
jgi:hypothetical protein